MNSRSTAPHQQCSELHARNTVIAESMASFVNLCRRRLASDLAQGAKPGGIIVRHHFAKHSVDDGQSHRTGSQTHQNIASTDQLHPQLVGEVTEPNANTS